MILLARATASRSTMLWRMSRVFGSISFRFSRLQASLTRSMIVFTAMPLATSPALYPPMPSASTHRPMSGWLPMLSSLCSLTFPTSVSATWANLPLRLISLEICADQLAHMGSDGAQRVGHLGPGLEPVHRVFCQRGIDQRVRLLREILANLGYRLVVVG